MTADEVQNTLLTGEAGKINAELIKQLYIFAPSDEEVGDMDLKIEFLPIIYFIYE